MPKLEIDAATWAELSELLDAALDRPPAQRDQWLDTLAPQFDGLKPRLRDLLSRAAEAETADFLNTLPAIDFVAPEADVQGDRAGDTVGNYRLIRELGSGGMGAVWLAERSDGLIARPVALKLPHGLWRRAGLAERMAREREILATLNHPNIARLYDAGLTADGQPYLAIEYVEGQPIDVHCRERQLDLHTRLKLFSQVANAVAYAHGNLIVHRDLKPANIMVTPDGQVRLLDFGIAKLLQEGHASETRLTEISGRALTPDYASPEQILGAPLTISSDVYSLGVILYELLSGVRPYRLKRDSRGALEDAIVQAEPVAPSEGADKSHAKALRGDLDTITLKALRKEPRERYPTVHMFLDDIERYLDGRPVLAQPDSSWYRIRKFIARNKIAVGAVAAILAAIVIGATVVAWQARVAMVEKRRAQEVKEFIASVFREADPTQGKGKVLSAVELLKQAQRRLQDRGNSNPGTRLELLAIIGESLFGLQENAEAARVMEQALQLQAASPVKDDLLGARLHLVLSQAYEYLGRNDEALHELGLSFANLTAASATRIPLFVEAKLHESAMGLATADYQVAERAANEAIGAAAAIIGPRSEQVATALQLLSKSYIFTERGPQSVARSKEALELMTALHQGDLAHPQVIDSAMYYGNALQFVGDFDAAAVVIAGAVDEAVAKFGEDNRLVGELRSHLVIADLERGNLAGAVQNSRRSIEIYLNEAQAGTPLHAYRLRLLGHSLLAARAGPEAVEQLDEAVRVSVSSNSAAGATTARASLGMALAFVGRFEEAEAQLQQTLKEAVAGTRPEHQAQRHLGTLLKLQGRYAEAVPWLEKSIVATVEPNYRGDLAIAFSEAGQVRLELGDLEAAQVHFDQAETQFDGLQKNYTTPARADLWVGAARLHLQRRNYEKALQLTQQADLFWRNFGADSRWAGEAALWLGRCYLALGRSADAYAELSRAEKILAHSPIPADVELVKLARKR